MLHAVSIIILIICFVGLTSNTIVTWTSYSYITSFELFMGIPNISVLFDFNSKSFTYLHIVAVNLQFFQQLVTSAISISA